jgi:hypothetical protein
MGILLGPMVGTVAFNSIYASTYADMTAVKLGDSYSGVLYWRKRLSWPYMDWKRTAWLSFGPSSRLSWCRGVGMTAAWTVDEPDSLAQRDVAWRDNVSRLTL